MGRSLTLGLLLFCLGVPPSHSSLYAQARGSAPPTGGCPRIAAVPGPNTTVRWSGNWGAEAEAEATITFFAFECFAEHHPAVESTSKSGTHRMVGAYTDYMIVMTVDFDTAVSNAHTLLGLNIEAVSAKNVVLGECTIHFWADQRHHHETNRIILSGSEIERVVKLRIKNQTGNKV